MELLHTSAVYSSRGPWVIQENQLPIPVRKIDMELWNSSWNTFPTQQTIKNSLAGESYSCYIMPLVGWISVSPEYQQRNHRFVASILVGWTASLNPKSCWEKYAHGMSEHVVQLWPFQARESDDSSNPAIPRVGFLWVFPSTIDGLGFLQHFADKSWWKSVELPHPH